MAAEGLKDVRGLAAGRREAAREADFEGAARSDGVVLVMGVEMNLRRTCDCRHWRRLSCTEKCHTRLLMHSRLVRGMLGRLAELVRWS